MHKIPSCPAIRHVTIDCTTIGEGHLIKTLHFVFHTTDEHWTEQKYTLTLAVVIAALPQVQPTEGAATVDHKSTYYDFIV